MGRGGVSSTELTLKRKCLDSEHSGTSEVAWPSQSRSHPCLPPHGVATLWAARLGCSVSYPCQSVCAGVGFWSASFPCSSSWARCSSLTRPSSPPNPHQGSNSLCISKHSSHSGPLSLTFQFFAAFKVEAAALRYKWRTLDILLLLE